MLYHSLFELLRQIGIVASICSMDRIMLISNCSTLSKDWGNVKNQLIFQWLPSCVEILNLRFYTPIGKVWEIVVGIICRLLTEETKAVVFLLSLLFLLISLFLLILLLLPSLLFASLWFRFPSRSSCCCCCRCCCCRCCSCC